MNDGRGRANGTRIVNDRPISWDSQLSMGVKALDEQHKLLLSVVNDLYEAMSEGLGNTFVLPVVERLRWYASEHFVNEEIAMARARYPELEKHRRIHTELLERVKAFQYTPGPTGDSQAKDLLVFLREWLVGHMLRDDRHFKAYLEETRQQLDGLVGPTVPSGPDSAGCLLGTRGAGRLSGSQGRA